MLLGFQLQGGCIRSRSTYAKKCKIPKIWILVINRPFCCCCCCFSVTPQSTLVAGLNNWVALSQLHSSGIFFRSWQITHYLSRADHPLLPQGQFGQKSAGPSKQAASFSSHQAANQAEEIFLGEKITKDKIFWGKCQKGPGPDRRQCSIEKLAKAENCFTRLSPLLCLKMDN